MANPILTKNSQEKVTSPEQLNDYIKVSNVGLWLILAVVIIMMSSVLVWGFVGNLNTTVKAVGIAENGKIVCYIPSTENAAPGNEVTVNGVSGTVESVSYPPLTENAVSEKYDEYTAYQLNLSDWNYEIIINAENCPDGIVNVNIITGTVKPISFISG
ncbi:MAG: hypothetical protein VZR27_07790 [Acutalibacteraceae bacterium]|nr:hypothetical protein [Acutalibacteraceae bacterium]